MSIGDNLKKIRKNKKMTQEDFGKLVGLSTNTVQRYELGKRQPNIETINKIAEALGVPITELINNDYDKSKYELEKALLNGSSNISNLVINFENSAKEEAVKNFRNLIEFLDWKEFRNINDDDIFEVINSQELYNYLNFLFFQKLNENK